MSIPGICCCCWTSPILTSYRLYSDAPNSPPSPLLARPSFRWPDAPNVHPMCVLEARGGLSTCSSTSRAPYTSAAGTKHARVSRLTPQGVAKGRAPRPTTGVADTTRYADTHVRATAPLTTAHRTHDALSLRSRVLSAGAQFLANDRRCTVRRACARSGRALLFGLVMSAVDFAGGLSCGRAQYGSLW